MPEITVKLNQVSCRRTSYGWGDDDIYLSDPTNKNKVVGTSVTHIGNMGRDGVKADLQLMKVAPAPAIDSLECLISVVKVGPLGSIDEAECV